ncbi:MAG: hypothetical protein EOP61_34795, partial [Sphingomonadales bacterium]
MSDLISFERAVYGRAPDRVARLLPVLRAMITDGLVDDDAHPELKPDRALLIRRLAAAVTALFADPATEIDPDTADRLAPMLGGMRHILDLAGDGGSDHLLRLLGDAPVGSSAGQVLKRFA